MEILNDSLNVQLEDELKFDLKKISLALWSRRGIAIKTGVTIFLIMILLMLVLLVVLV